MTICETCKGEYHRIEDQCCYCTQSEQRIAELEQQRDKLQKKLDERDGAVCDQCIDSSGWCENAVEGRYPCTCMTEAEPYQLLEQQRGELQSRANHYEAENGRQAEMLNEAIQQRDDLLAAAENLIRVKGRHHTEQAYKALEAAITKVKP